jgi:hypothetical protein
MQTLQALLQDERILRADSDDETRAKTKAL